MLDPGTSAVLTGPNGAGKTTLLRIVATLLKPSDGDGRVAGFSLTDAPDAVRGATAYVSSRGFLYDDLTAAENLRFAARLVDAPLADDRLADLLAMAGIAHAADRPVRGFSTGMRRRLSLVGVCLRPVEVALIDEPYAGLDSEGVALADRLVADLLADGSTVLLASHQDGAATRAASRSLRLVDGRLTG